MSIQNVYGSIATNQAPDVLSVGTSTPKPGSIAPTSGGVSTATISTPGQLFSDLQQLSQTNPTQFKAVASQLAASFQSAAGQATGPDAQALSSLADRFNQAAQTGSLQPAQAPTGAVGQAGGASGSGGAHHHHHHHGGGGGGGSSNAVQQALESALTTVTRATQGAQASAVSSLTQTSLTQPSV